MNTIVKSTWYYLLKRMKQGNSLKGDGIMKKMMNKKGFTLVEMVLVVGIITILSSVVIVGITTSTNDYRDRILRSAQDHQAFMNDDGVRIDMFEQGAQFEIRAAIPNREELVEAANSRPSAHVNNVDSHYVIPSAEPVTPTPAPVTPTPSSATPTPRPSAPTTTTTTTTTTTAATTTAQPQETTTQAAANVVTSSDNNTNAPGASVRTDGYWGGTNANMSFSLPQNASEFTFYVPGNPTGLSCWTGNCNVTVNGNYVTVTMNPGYSTSGSGFGINCSGSFDPSQIRLISYTPA